MIGGFCCLMTERASEGASPAFLLEVFSGLDTAVAKSPEKQVNLGDGFSIPDGFPDCWIGRDVWET